MSKTKYHCDLNKRRLVLWLTVRLAPYAASYVDKNTAVRSLCPGRTKTTGVSQLFLCSRRRYSQWQQIAAGCTSCPARLLVLGLCSGTAWLCPRDKLELSLILKQRLETVLVSLATQPSLFSFFSPLALSCPSPPNALSQYDSGSNSVWHRSPGVWLKREVSFLAVYILRVSV